MLVRLAPTFMAVHVSTVSVEFIVAMLLKSTLMTMLHATGVTVKIVNVRQVPMLMAMLFTVVGMEVVVVDLLLLLMAVWLMSMSMAMLFATVTVQVFVLMVLLMTV